MPGTTWKRGKKNQGPKARARRQGALERLKQGLKDNHILLNTEKITTDSEGTVKYLKSEIKRQDKEIAILEGRV